MKLLIFANKVDVDGDLLGFFPGWLSLLSEKFEKITVITQYAGNFSFKDNVRVVSLDKNRHPSKMVRLFAFWHILWLLKGEYDLFFAFMAPAWLIAAWPVLLFAGKKSALWYAVWKDSLKLRLATILTDKVLVSVPKAFPFKTAKLSAIGQGIDTEKFQPGGARESGRILSLGRISPIKKIELLLNALKIVYLKSPEIFGKIKIEIAGGPASLDDEKYLENLKQATAESGLGETISWPGKIRHGETPTHYQKADIFINLTPTGSFDKTILEAMASGCLALASNRALPEFYSPEMNKILIFEEGNAADLAEKIKYLVNLPETSKNGYREALRKIVIENHSQENLIGKISEIFYSINK